MSERAFVFEVGVRRAGRWTVEGMRERQQTVGFPTHGRDHDNDVMTLLTERDDLVRKRFDALGGTY